MRTRRVGAPLSAARNEFRESRGPEIKRAGRNLLHHGRTRLSAHPFKGELLLLKKTLLLGNIERPLQRIATAYGTDADRGGLGERLRGNDNRKHDCGNTAPDKRHDDTSHCSGNWLTAHDVITAGFSR